VSYGCGNCRFHENGRCRRFPPSGRPSGWPQVHGFDWCGEFQAMTEGPSAITEPVLPKTEPVLPRKRGRPRKNPLPQGEVLP